MECQRCRRKKLKKVYYYSGTNICFNCIEEVNPITNTVTRLSEFDRSRLNDIKSKLEEKLQDINHKLKIDDKLIAENLTEITYKIPRKKR